MRDNAKMPCAPAAVEYKERNRGTLGAVLQTDPPPLNPSYASPRPMSRSGFNKQAEENLAKGRGSMGDWLNMDNSRDYCSPRPNPKLHGETARGLAQRGRGTMDKVMNVDGNRDYFSPRPGKNRPEAQEFRDRDFHGKMGGVMDVSGNRGYYSPQPAAKVKGEGQDIAQKSINGSLSKVMDLDANRGYSSSRPRPRVRSEGADTYEQHQGSINKFLDQDGN